MAAAVRAADCSSKPSDWTWSLDSRAASAQDILRGWDGLATFLEHGLSGVRRAQLGPCGMLASVPGAPLPLLLREGSARRQ